MIQYSDYDFIAWDEKYFCLFISHSSSVSELLNALSHELAKYAIKGFVAHADIQPTTDWEQEIIEHLNQSDALLAVLTSDFSESQWTDQEVGFYLNNSGLVIPLDIETQPYGFMGRYQSLPIDNLNNPSVIARRIFDVLNSNDKTNKKLSNAVINKLISSWSYSKARFNYNLLRELTFLDASREDEIIEAYNNNSQLRDNHSISESGIRYIMKQF